MPSSRCSTTVEGHHQRRYLLLSAVFFYIAIIALFFSSSQQQQVKASSLPLTLYTLLDYSSIAQLDGVDQSFYADFYLNVFYQDPGIPNITAAESGKAASAARSDARVVKPELDFTNAKSLSSVFQGLNLHQGRVPYLAALNVTDQFPGYPWIEIAARYSGTLKLSMPLHDFPYDVHEVPIHLETTQNTEKEVVFNNSFDTRPNFTTSVSILEWDVRSSRVESSLTYYPNFVQNYSRRTWWVKIERRSEYFSNKIIAGIALLIVMCRFCYCVVTEDFNRLLMMNTCYVGIITYLFVIGEGVPKISYMTRIDKFVEFAQILIFADFSASIILYIINTVALEMLRRAKVVQEEELAATAALKEKEQKRKKKKTKGEPVLLGSKKGEATGAQEAATEANDDDDGTDKLSELTEDEEYQQQQWEKELESLQHLDPIGWWTHWSKWRRWIDVIVAFLMTIVTVIGSPIVLFG